MGTIRLGSFPSLDNKRLTDNIDKGIFAYFLNHFPRNFFSNVYMDNQTGSSGNYIINTNGELSKIESGKKLNNPTCRLNIRHGGNTTIDPFGGDIWNVNQQPGAFGVDPDLTGYRPILYDPYGVIIALNERTIRSQFDITMTFDSKDDQMACCNYLDSGLKMNYVSVIPVQTFIPIHRLMLEYLRASIFKSEINVLSKMKSDSDEKDKYQKQINEMFMKHLYQFSEAHIKPYAQIDPKNENSDYVYGYLQTQRVTIRFEKYEADEGTKKGNAWSNFNVSISGWIEFGNPISFITSVPAIIRGAKNNWRMKTSSQTDRSNYYHLMKFKEIFKDTRHLARVNGNIYDHFYLEKEIMMSSVTENFNILDDVINKDDTPIHYSVMSALLKTIKSQEDFNRLFHVVIYKQDEPLSNKYYTIDEKFNFCISHCDLTIPYYIDIFVNKYEYKNKINEMNEFLRKIGIDPNRIRYSSIYNLDYLNKNYTGQFGSINTIAGTVYDKTSNEILELVRAIPSEFLVLDTSFTYYMMVDDSDGNHQYYNVNEDQIRTNTDAEIYIKDASGNYIEADRSKIFIPNPKITFYTYDRSSDKFNPVNNLESFDKLQTYYVTSKNLKGGRSILINDVNGIEDDDLNVV